MKVPTTIFVAPEDSGAVGGCWFDASAERLDGMVPFVMKSTLPDHETAAKATAIAFRRLMEYYEPDEADAWLNSPHPQLNNNTAISLIAAGRGGEVHAIIDRLDDDSYI